MTKVKLQTTIAITALIASIAAVPTYVFAGAKQQDPPPPRMNQGQRRPGQRPPAGAMRLLMDPAVKKELSLTDDQLTKLKSALQKQGHGQDTPPPPPPSDDQGQGAPTPPNQGNRADRAKAEHETLKSVLSDTQYQRFSEIELQAMGARGLLRPDIATKLNLTDDQKSQIEELAPRPMGGGMPPMPGMGGGMPPTPPQGQGGPPGAGPDDQGGPPPPPPGMGGGGPGMGMAPRGGGPGSPEQEAMTQKALKILTSDQLATYKTLVGKTFKFSRPPRQGGPGDGQAPPPDGGGAPDDVQANVIKVK